MIDYFLTCEECEVALFVANQNFAASKNKVLNFFSADIERFLADHFAHRISFMFEYGIDNNYKQSGNYDKNRSKVVPFERKEVPC